MGEGAPKSKEQDPEKGSYTDFDGSFDSHVNEARTKALGTENAMQGIQEAAGLAKTLENLGAVAQKFPEFRYWVDRKLKEVEGIAKKAKAGEGVLEDGERWQQGTDAILENWKGERKEIEWFETIKDNLQYLRELHTAIKNIKLVERDENGSALPEEEQKKARAADIETIESIENHTVQNDDNEESLYQVRRLYKKYGLKLPLSLTTERPSNRIRAEIADEEKK